MSAESSASQGVVEGVTDEDSGNAYTNPIDVAALPEDQGPAVSESTFLRLQKQRPIPPSGGGGGEQHTRPRPSDITVTGPAYDFHDPNASASSILRQAAASQRRGSSPFAGASPRGAMRSASPRHLSPATSQIFERDVQEAATLDGAELSPAIPSHIQIEDHIPPVLEASSEVITNSRIDPEDVEIVTHAAHQSAALSVAGATGSFIGGGGESSHLQQQDLGSAGLPHFEQPEDIGGGSSSHGAVDPPDPRRLSFISFADVVHAEHVHASKEAAGGAFGSIQSTPQQQQQQHQLMSPSSFASSDFSSPRTASPARSPIRATAASATLPLSPASLVDGGPSSQHGDLTIETMAKTLENPARSDLIPTLPSTPPPQPQA